jgi:hypothetical protein
MSNSTDVPGSDFSVAMSAEVEGRLVKHFDRGLTQEDLCFAYWAPSRGHSRLTAIIRELALPVEGDRILQGNVAFTVRYIERVLRETPPGCGIALLHSHLGPGWQGMSRDDLVAEHDRLASAVVGRSGLPLVGLTWGTDGSWSGRSWVRSGRRRFMRRSAVTVRSVGRRLHVTYHPRLRPAHEPNHAQVATVSVWGKANQADLVRLHVGIVGLGSVGSVVAEALARIGIRCFTLIDHDRIEWRNLDRTAGARRQDIAPRTPKVAVAERNIQECATAEDLNIQAYPDSLLTQDGLARALDCDVIFCCVDRPLPRHILNAMAYAHLIPVVDGGIYARTQDERLVHADWRIQAVGPGRACLICVGALRWEEIALDLGGKLDDPDYIQNLPSELRSAVSRRNVFPFSLSVAAHEMLQFVGLATGNARIGGVGPQMYHAYPGRMSVEADPGCKPNCSYVALTASAADLGGNFRPPVA